MVRLLLMLALLCITAHVAAQIKGGAPAVAEIAAERLPAGKVELTEGNVQFVDANRSARRPRVGDAIYEGESIATGADGEVHVRMEDGGYMAVRPGTRMRIVNFRAQADAEDRSVIALLQGSFRSVTGWIARGGRDRAVVNTPTATIGIRGTEHEPLVIPQGSTIGEPGTYDRVRVGETEIRTKQGTVAVRPNQAGFAALSGAVRPRVLDRIPTFFRPTRNEGRLTGLHERVRLQLDQHREERRRFVEERRKLKGQETGKSAGPGAGKGKGERQRDKGGQAREEKKQSAQDRKAERSPARDEKKERAQNQKSEIRDDRKRKAEQERRKQAEEKKQHRSPDKQRERREEKKQKAAEVRREPARVEKKDHAKGGK